MTEHHIATTQVPCAHIADYYDELWRRQHCIGYNVLRWGYRQWAEGRAVTVAFGKPANNLYEEPQ